MQPRGTYSARMWSSRSPFEKNPVSEIVNRPALNRNGLWSASHVETLSEHAPGVVEAFVGAGDGPRAAALGEGARWMVWGVHAPPSIDSVPGSQVFAQVASALAVPFITEMWAPHVGVEWGAHGVLSLLEE